MRMKNIIRLVILAAVLSASFSACSIWEDHPRAEADVNGEGLVLTFFSDDSFLETKTITQVNGEDRYNENILSSVEYFLYTEHNADGDAVLHGYLENVRQNAPVTIPMTLDVVNQVLCPNNAVSFYVYAIANHSRIVADSNPEDLSGTSVADLEALTRDIDMSNGSPTTTQSNFLMATDGALEVTNVNRRITTVASAKVNLKRVAAKITIAIRVEPSVTFQNIVTVSGVSDTLNEVWKPRVDEMAVYLVNGAKTGLVSGLPKGDSERFSYQQAGFDMTNGESHPYEKYVKRVAPETGAEVLDSEGFVIYDKTSVTGNFYPCTVPFYSYPLTWGYGTDEEPYLKLVIPWDREPGVSTGGRAFGNKSTQYYYRVYCPATEVDATSAQFLRNNWYKVILNVGILGSETDGGEMIINGEYYVVDWQERLTGSTSGEEGPGINDSDKEAEIKGARYLFVNEDSYTLYNIDDLMIPYKTSDPCEIVDFTATTYLFNGSSKTTTTTSDPSAWNIDLALVTTPTGAHVSFSHLLNNDLTTTDYDVSQYEITFTVRQKDDHNYAKTITITQYPAIVIDMDNNEGGTHDGYTYINGGTGTTYGTNGTSSGTNTNFNMFIIKTSVLPADSDYLLGDPRLTDIDNLNSWPTKNSAVSTWSASAASIQGGANRRLSYYHPVDNSTSVDNIIAPEVRIASSHGATTTLNYQYAFRRCASYQEKGYPAGRWRLPTVAEIMYITKLSSDGRIATLFGGGGSNSDYWCNSGYVRVYNSGASPRAFTGTTGNKYVRCVYDEWYWDGIKYNGTDHTTVTPLTTFKWGDIQ